MYRVKFKASAEKQLNKLHINIQKRLISRLEFFLSQINPLLYADKLTDSRLGQYRFRVGDYRIAFDLEGVDTIMIVKVGHRREIYR